jgi:hopene-associated glycosyltransferase HpnB
MDWRTSAEIAISALPVIIWIYLLCARGGFWRVKPHLPTALQTNAPAKRVAVVIPARNEAGVIAETVKSLLCQAPPVVCSIVVVDDASTDGTADIALAAANELGRRNFVCVLKAPVLPPGWTGKMWAVSQGVQRALADSPDFLLLTDADIRHGRDSVAQLAAVAEQGGFDLVSFMVRLHCATFAERALIPAFVFFFFLLYPPRWIRDPRRKTAGAAGGSMLLRPAMLRRAGGIESIRSEVIDDCALAQRVKQAGGRIWLGLTNGTASTRRYESFGEIERMISRTAFRQLNHSGLLLLATVAGLTVTYVLPAVLTFSGNRVTALLGAAAWLLMAAAYLPMVRFYNESLLWAAALPAVAVFYATATFHSAFKYWMGSGGEWKGRAQDSR